MKRRIAPRSTRYARMKRSASNLSVSRRLASQGEALLHELLRNSLHAPQVRFISKTKTHPIGCVFVLEVTIGFEPMDNGVADRGLTTWLRHHNIYGHD